MNKNISTFLLCLLALGTVQAADRATVLSQMNSIESQISTVFTGFQIVKYSPSMLDCLTQTQNATNDFLNLIDLLNQDQDFADDFNAITLQLRNQSVYMKTCYGALEALYYNINARLNLFPTFNDYLLAFGQNALGKAVSLSGWFTKIANANKQVPPDQFTILYYTSKVFSAILDVKPLADSDGNVAATPAPTSSAQFVASLGVPVSFTGDSYSIGETIGQPTNFFAHPLYMVDFLSGIIQATHVISQPSIDTCSNSLRQMTIAVLNMDEGVQAIFQETFNILYYANDVSVGCYNGIFNTISTYLVNRFVNQDPKYLARNVLMNFGKMFKDGTNAVSFFNAQKTSAGATDYKNAGSVFGDILYLSLFS